MCNGSPVTRWGSAHSLGFLLGTVTAASHSKGLAVCEALNNAPQHQANVSHCNHHRSPATNGSETISSRFRNHL